jgi:hypothetical protein
MQLREFIAGLGGDGMALSRQLAHAAPEMGETLCK